LQDIVLSVKHLTVYQETHAAVQEVSFSLTASTNVALVGPNGAGKTTLVQAILGILPRQAGNILALREFPWYPLDIAFREWRTFHIH
jgi:zinc transport system ATP-binding protein